MQIFSLLKKPVKKGHQSKNLELSFFILLFLFVLTGCQKEEIDPDYSSVFELKSSETLWLGDIFKYGPLDFSGGQGKRKLIAKDLINNFAKLHNLSFEESYFKLKKIYKKPFPWYADTILLNKLLTRARIQNKIAIAGVKGTGKSTWSLRFAQVLSGEFKRVKRIDLRKNPLDKEGFLNEIKKAKLEPNKNFCLIFSGLSGKNNRQPWQIFGEDIWKKMDNESYQVKLESGEELEFPKNIFFIYLLNISPNNNFLFNPEISRVFGLVYSLYPEPITYLKYMEKFPDHDLIEKKKILYMFKKTNSFIAKRFGKEYQLGHWSSLMNLDFEGNWIEHFREIFIFHISSIKGNAEDRQQRKQLLNKAMLNFEESFNKKGFGLIITKSGEKQENYLLSIFKTVDAFFWMLGIILSSLVALIGRQILSKKRKITHSLMDEGDLIIKRWQENKITDEMATKMLKSLSAKVFRKGRNNQLNADAANMLQMQIKAHMDTLEISRKIQPQIEDKDLSSEIKKLISQSLNDNILEDHEIENLMDALKEKYSLNSEAQNQIKNLLKTKK